MEPILIVKGSAFCFQTIFMNHQQQKE